MNGYASAELKHPEIVPFQPVQILNDYTDNMRLGSEHVFRKSYFQGFLAQLNGSQSIQTMLDEHLDRNNLI